MIMSLEDKIYELQYSDAYADYIMDQGYMGEIAIYNGDSLTKAMEMGYLFKDFLFSIGCADLAYIYTKEFA
jgi:hypothetical protein